MKKREHLSKLWIRNEHWCANITWINWFASSIVKAQSHVCFRNVSHKTEEIQIIFERYSRWSESKHRLWISPQIRTDALILKWKWMTAFGFQRCDTWIHLELAPYDHSIDVIILPSKWPLFLGPQNLCLCCHFALLKTPLIWSYLYGLSVAWLCINGVPYII